jgi:polyvinyl alcohol dehydrogenase (cytochrome)
MKRALAALAVTGALVATVPARSADAQAPVPTSQLPCPAWSMYGATLGRTFSNDCASPINPTTVATLVPAWFIDTARPVTATPVVVDGVVYVGSWDAIMYALDAETGAIEWTFQAPPSPGATFGPIVSSAAVADVPFGDTVRRLVIFGSGPRVFALDARDGTQVWVHDASMGIEGTPTEFESSPAVHGDLVLIGRDTHNEPESETGGVVGGMAALDVRTGQQRWAFEPERDAGLAGFGCGGVWSSPAVDPIARRVFFGSANCPSDDFPEPWPRAINAVTAVDLDTGAWLWSFRPESGPPPDDDTDFGATPNLFVDANGRQVLGAGKKDGTYYALDPATGALLWDTHVADPAPNVGGFIGSPAIYEGNVFGGTAIGSPPFFHSLDGVTGAVRFQGGVGPTYGATAVVNGVAFNSALDDVLKAFDTETGRLLWASPLSGPGSSSVAIYEDMVFIGAGTSTSDACAKDNPTDDACVFVFDVALATAGGIHAFRLLAPGESPPGASGPSGGGTAPPPAAAAPAVETARPTGALARTGAGPMVGVLGAALLAVAVLGRRVSLAAGRR